MKLSLSADGSDPRALFAAVANLPDFSNHLPREVNVEGRRVDVDTAWIDKVVGGTEVPKAHARWPGPERNPYAGPFLSMLRTGVVGWRVPREIEVAEVLELAARLPLEVFVLGVHPPWDSATAGFADGHRAHGWGVVFKGAGHDRLVSRRWLAHGPWLVRHIADDLTYVQFHDLDADLATAWAQAERAHDRMGIDYNVGGYIHPEHEIRTRIKGLYNAGERSLTITRGNGQPMSQGEMLDLCVYRARMRTDAQEPIERVRVVFMEERDARRHLHELWLRELECWFFDAEGRETRADDSYQPERIAPEWVERVEGARPAARELTATISLGLASLLADPEGELPGGYCRDDLLFHLLDRTEPPAGYEIREILGAHIPRVSASEGDEGDLVVTVSPGVGGAMRPDDAAPLLVKARSVPQQCELRIPCERLGLTVPAIVAPEPYPDQRPMKSRARDDHPLNGVVVHAVGDVLARVRSLNREELRPVESLLRLCVEDRFVLSAVPAASKGHR